MGDALPVLEGTGTAVVAGIDAVGAGMEALELALLLAQISTLRSILLSHWP